MDKKMTLTPVSPKNWRDAVFLTTDAERNNPLDQRWVTSNAFSLLQTVFDPAWDCRLILADGEAVGFVFYGYWEEKDGYLLCRYMIDVAQQGKGYGKAALPLVVSQIRQQYGCRDVYLTVEDENTRAIKMYTDFGFQRTEEMDCSERIYILKGE